MELNLYRISTMKKNAWSNEKPKPVYFVAHSKEAAKSWADENLKDGLTVKAVTKLARQIAGHVFVGE